MPCKATIYNIITKLHSTGLVLDKKKFRKRHVLTEEKLMISLFDYKQAQRSHYVFWLFRVGWQKEQLIERTTGPVFFHETINSKCYVRLLLSPCFDQQTDDEKSCQHFMQDNVTAYNAKNYIDAIDEDMS
jgi:hypothetical protein